MLIHKCVHTYVLSAPAHSLTLFVRSYSENGITFNVARIFLLPCPLPLPPLPPLPPHLPANAPNLQDLEVFLYKSMPKYIRDKDTWPVVVDWEVGEGGGGRGSGVGGNPGLISSWQPACTLHACACTYTLARMRARAHTHVTRMRGSPASYNTLQHTATHCNTLHSTALHCTTLQYAEIPEPPAMCIWGAFQLTEEPTNKFEKVRNRSGGTSLFQLVIFKSSCGMNCLFYSSVSVASGI